MWIKVVEPGLDLLVLCFLPVGLKNCFTMSLPDLKQNQGKLKKKKEQWLLRLGSREKKKEEESILDVIREICRYHSKFGGEEVGDDKHMLGRLPRAISLFFLVYSF